MATAIGFARFDTDFDSDPDPDLFQNTQHAYEKRGAATVQCPKCKFNNPEDSSFCLVCGRKFEQACPQCGKPLPTRAKFCNECGHNLRESPETLLVDYDEPQTDTPKYLADKILTTRNTLKGERKLVTVLFADVANYTAMSERLDPEEVHQIMDKCFQTLIEQVHHYEGTINQFTGDGIMALFGAPIAHEDHVKSGIKARHAYSIQTAMNYFDQAKQLGNPTLLWRTHQSCGKLYLKLDNVKAAKSEFQNAVKIVNDIADGLTEPDLKTNYLQSDTIKELFNFL